MFHLRTHLSYCRREVCAKFEGNRLQFSCILNSPYTNYDIFNHTNLYLQGMSLKLHVPFTLFSLNFKTSSFKYLRPLQFVILCYLTQCSFLNLNLMSCGVRKYCIIYYGFGEQTIVHQHLNQSLNIQDVCKYCSFRIFFLVYQIFKFI